MLARPLFISLKYYKRSKLPTNQPLDARDFYKKFPSGQHEAGDIWTNIPTSYFFGQKFERAIVITPSCDLAQSKVEVINFVPIIPVQRYVYTKSFFKEITDYISNQVNSYLQSDLISTSRFKNIKKDDIQVAISLIKDDKKGIELKSKLVEYIKYIDYTEEGGIHHNSIKPDISKIITVKLYNTYLKKIASNSFKTDIHFLPYDKQILDYSAVQAHSLALFRYCFAVPIEILDLAARSSERNWQNDLAGIHIKIPSSKEFDSYPIKLSALKDDFLSDMLSRYISMYIRLGSRDFTNESLENFVEEMRL